MVDTQYIELVDGLENASLANVNEDWIETMIAKYPCFHGAYQIKGIILKQKDEELFEESLPGIAIRVNNRAVLYDKVHAQYGGLKKTKKKPVSKPVARPVTEEGKAIKSSEARDTSKMPTGDTEDLKSLVQAIRTKRKEHPIKSKVERKPKNIESAVNKNKPLKAKPKAKTAKKKVPVSKTKKPASFTEWLKNQKPVEDSSSTQIPIDHAVSNEAEIMLEAKRSSYKLEDFLVTQIQRKQGKKGGKQDNLSHAVSETYAIILADQGKIDEAIAIYKELSIKYPKKSSTFARQIEKLKSS